MALKRLNAQTEPVPNGLRTEATVEENDGGLLVRVVAYEPNMADVVAPARNRDDPDVWLDNEIEIMVDPMGARREFMHFTVNSSGSWTDLRHSKTSLGEWVGDVKWSSNAKVAVKRFHDRWTCDIAIPSSVFQDGLPRRFPAELYRRRVLKGDNSMLVERYVGGPYASGPCDFDNFGTWEIR